MISEMAAGKKQRIRSNRIVNTGSTSAAGRWHEAFAISQGTGGIGVLTGTAGVGVARDASSSGSLPLNPVSVSPDTRHVQALMCYSPATTLVPGLCNLIDILYIYPSCIVTTGAGTTLSNAAAKPTRFNNGKDVKLGAIVAGTAIGASTPLITCLYTDQDGNTGNSGFLSAAANSLPIGALFSGSAIAIPGSPEMLFATGDTGIRSLDSYSTVAGTTGTITFFLYRDLAEVPIIAANLGGERDYLSQIPSLPTIDDNACLTFLTLTGGALLVNQPIVCTVQMAWG
jgi:hypothetical protein